MFKKRIFISVLIVCALSLVEIAKADYRKVSPNENITLGEYVFDDNFVATTSACTIGINDPNGNVKIVSTTPMTATSTGWHYYSYTIPSDATSGVWPAVMICGSIAGGDLVKVDKTFAVAPSDLNSITSAISSASSSLNSAIVANTSGITSAVNANTNASLLTATSSLAAVVNGNTNSAIANASSSLASAITANGNVVASSVNGTISSTISTASTSIAASVWSNPTRTLTDYGNDITASDVWNYIGTVVHSGSSGSWTTNISDTQQILAGSTYRVKAYTTNGGQPANPSSVPSISVYDVNRNVIVSNVAMTNIGTGIYEYSYSVPTGAEQGMWETIISTTVTGGTITNSDYWEVRGAPAQVIINSISDATTPSIAANVTITNEGTASYEYQYEWCVVPNQNNSCGGGDDISYGSAAKLIQPGQDWNTTLTADVPNVGNYFFKVVAYFGTESSGSSRSFTATEGSGTSPSNGGGGSGGSGGGSSNSSENTSLPTIVPGKYKSADLNMDGYVNSTDFSILLSFWHLLPPYKNQRVDINKDNKVNSVDFSIMLAQWDANIKR